MRIANIYETVTVNFSGTDFHCHCLKKSSKSNFYLVTLSTPPPPPIKEQKRTLLGEKNVTKNGFCLLNKYLVLKGGRLFPQKITCIKSFKNEED